MGTAAEEGGKVATTIVESMKSQPLAVALVVVNLAFLGFAAYFLHDLATISGATNVRRDTMFSDVLKSKQQTMDLLTHCLTNK
jgi:hypothetical protein